MFVYPRPANCDAKRYFYYYHFSGMAVEDSATVLRPEFVPSMRGKATAGGAPGPVRDEAVPAGVLISIFKLENINNVP